MELRSNEIFSSLGHEWVNIVNIRLWLSLSDSICPKTQPWPIYFFQRYNQMFLTNVTFTGKNEPHLNILFDQMALECTEIVSVWCFYTAYLNQYRVAHLTARFSWSCMDITILRFLQDRAATEERACENFYVLFNCIIWT